MFHNSIVKISGILNNHNLLKTCIQTTYTINFCLIYNQFTMGKQLFLLLLLLLLFFETTK